MTKQIIRIEHPSDNKGLFRSMSDGDTRLKKHSQWNSIENRHCNMNKFPTYWCDDELKAQIKLVEGDIDEMDKYYFAFHSLEVLNEALTPDELKEAINDLGFRVYMIEVDSCLESQYQVMFKPEHVTSKKDISFMFI